ncbi:maleylacetate reductase [Chelativorans salis]|uniref:Maleylacetate reductase n=1 Tax=Chelativorans salis TaxID=2978478 RepID=A0ABT2LN47_9HYPH|nr:maleylacetate reductase [Chelativorans sp. EGI FJ00035]MCT7374599.1 maleylacetate reductase [Chelativorans sp. EGI FJ00035]
MRERMDAFAYTALPGRVVFGTGTLAQLSEEMERLECRRAFVLSTPQQADKARELLSDLGEHGAGLFDGATMHTPVEVTERALAIARELEADCTVAFGGGSTIGLGKAIALRADLPQICIPTTYAGSEMTPIIGQTENGVKTTQRTEKVLPEVTIYDVDLTLTLPALLSATSGLNAMAHAVEALYAKDRNPVIALLAEEAVSALASALPKVVADGVDRRARTDALYGAWLCGMCLGSVGMALHHKLCHVLGGAFDLPHAETHAIVLPHALAYNAAAAQSAAAALSRALGTQDPAQALFDLAGKLGAPRALRQIGMPEDGIAPAAELALENPYWNPRPIGRDAIETLIARAWAGEPPSALR